MIDTVEKARALVEETRSWTDIPCYTGRPVMANEVLFFTEDDGRLMRVIDTEHGPRKCEAWLAG